MTEEELKALKFGETKFDGRMYYITKTFGGYVYSTGSTCCFVPVAEKTEPKTEKAEAKKVIKK